MGRNNANNMETPAQRLDRFQKGAPIESISTLLNSIDNHFNNEIKITPDHYQTTLMFIGIHASILTIGEVFFDNHTPQKKTNHFQNYKDFLVRFVDGPTPDTTFSAVANEIHGWRNIIAHQWLSTAGHEIEYNYTIPLGWERQENILVINPKIYCESYLSAFKAGGKIWGFKKLFTSEELHNIHTRIINKYQAR